MGEAEHSNIITSSAPEPDVPRIDLYRFLIQDWGGWSDNVALVDTSSRHQYTFQQALEAITRIAGDMLKHGLRCGDVISIWCSNSLDMVLGCLAALKIGATLAMIGSSLTADEGGRNIEKVKSDFAYVSSINRQKMQKGFEALKTLFTFGDCDFVSLYPQIRRTSSPHHISPTDTCIILFSSGTTGLPKAVELTHINMVTAFTLLSSKTTGRMLPAALIFAPMTHFYGIGSVLHNLFNGATTLLMPRFELEEYIRLTSEHRLMAMTLVPPVAVMITKHPELVKKYDLSSLFIIYSTGAVLSTETEGRLKELLPGTILMVSQGYGLTESSGAITTADEDTPVGSVGSIRPLLELKIVDVDSGKALGPIQKGELAVRGPTVMKGYLDDPRSTAEMIDSNGWLHTGDIAFYNEDKYIFIVDRIKEIIKHKGQQVAPAELEDVLLSHPDVEDVAVTGVPDEVMGELPAAFIVRKTGGHTTEKQFQEYVAERLAPYKQLTGGVRFVSSIPKTPSGKILRRLLKDNLNRSHL